MSGGDIEQLEIWIKQVEEIRETLKKLKMGDRLETLACLIKFHQAIGASLKGWSAWFLNPSLLALLSEEEFREIFDVFKQLSVQVLDLDLKMTLSVLKKKKSTKDREGKKYIN